MTTFRGHLNSRTDLARLVFTVDEDLYFGPAYVHDQYLGRFDFGWGNFLTFAFGGVFASGGLFFRHGMSFFLDTNAKRISIV